MSTFTEQPRPVSAQWTRRNNTSGPYFKDSDILSVLILPARWEGVCQEAAAPGPVVQCFGRWCVTDSVLFARGQAYSIPIATLGDAAAVDQLIAANGDWLYDPSDFLDAVEFALGQRQPAQDTTLLDSTATLEQRIWPFYPSHVLGHVYLVNRMQDAEIAALNRYLADQAVAPVNL